MVAVSGPPDLKEELGWRSGPQILGASSDRDCGKPGLSGVLQTPCHLSGGVCVCAVSSRGTDAGMGSSVGREAKFPQWWGAVPAASSLCLSLIPSPAVGASG